MAGDDADLDMQNLVDEVAERCLSQLRTERAQADQNQLEQINALLEHWSEQSFERTKELVLSNASNGQAGPAFSNNGFAEAAGDMRERQSSLLAVMHGLICCAMINNMHRFNIIHRSFLDCARDT